MKCYYYIKLPDGGEVQIPSTLEFLSTEDIKDNKGNVINKNTTKETLSKYLEEYKKTTDPKELEKVKYKIRKFLNSKNI